MRVVDKAVCDDDFMWYTVGFDSREAEDTMAYRWMLSTCHEMICESRDSIGYWYFMDVREDALVLLGVMYGEILSDQTAGH